MSLVSRSVACGGRDRGDGGGKVTFTTACVASLASVVLTGLAGAGCSGPVPRPVAPSGVHAARSPRVVSVALSAAPVAPAGARPVAVPFDPGSLHRIPQKPLTSPPDVWDPEGRSVGLYARGRNPRCELWDVATGWYRGPVPPSVCAAWKAEEGKSADGRRVVQERGRLVVRGGSAPPVILALDCAGTACGPVGATGIDRQGTQVAALRRGARAAVVWDARTGVITRRLSLSPAAAVAAVRVSEQGDVVVTARLDRSPFWTVLDFAPGVDDQGTAVTDDGVDVAVVDPFARRVFVSGAQFFHGAEHPFRRIRTIGGGDEPGLAWEEPTTPQKGRAWLAADGRTCVALATADPAVGEDAALSFYRPGEARAWIAGVAWPDRMLLDLSPDGDKAVWVQDQTTRVAYHIGDEQYDPHTKEAYLPPGMPRAVALSSDGARVAFGYDGHLEVRRPEAAGVDLFWAAQDRFAWSPTASTILAASGGGVVTVRDLDDRSVVFQAPGRLASRPFSPDGRWLAVLGARGLTVVDTRGWKAARHLRAGGPREAAFGPGGEVVVAGAGTSAVFDAAGKRVATIQATGSKVRFSTDGRAVHLQAKDGTWRIFDAATGRELRDVRRAGVLDPSGRFVCRADGGITRVRDGLVLRASAGGASIDGGAFAGADVVIAARVYRVGDDAVRGLLVPGRDLVRVLRRERLVRSFFHGETVSRPAVLARP